jgi:hypothetical protein
MSRPAPRRGSKIIAQGKTAEVAALGNAHPVPTLPFFWFGAPAGWRAKPEKGGGNHITSVTQGGARSSLALGYEIHVPTGLQFGSVRSERLAHKSKPPFPPASCA